MSLQDQSSLRSRLRRPAAVGLLFVTSLPLWIVLIFCGSQGTAACYPDLGVLDWVDHLFAGLLSQYLSISFLAWLAWFMLTFLMFVLWGFTHTCMGAVRNKLGAGRPTSWGAVVGAAIYATLCAAVLILVVRALAPVVFSAPQSDPFAFSFAAETAAPLSALTGRLTSLLALLGALLFAPFAVWKVLVAQEQATAARNSASASRKTAEAALEQAKIANKNSELALEQSKQERLVKVTGIFHEASSRLGQNIETGSRDTGTGTLKMLNPDHVVRLGAILSLARLIPRLNSFETWQLATTLSAQVKLEQMFIASVNTLSDSEDIQTSQATAARSRIVSALQVVGKAAQDLRDSSNSDWRFPLWLELDELADLPEHIEQMFFGYASLIEAQFNGTNLIECQFWSCKCDLSEFKNSTIENKNIDKFATNTSFIGSQFAKSFFKNLIFSNTQFINSDFSEAHFNNCKFINCAFGTSNFDAVHFDSCVFENCDGMTDDMLARTTAKDTTPPSGLKAPKSPQWISGTQSRSDIKKHQKRISGRAREIMRLGPRGAVDQRIPDTPAETALSEGPE